MYTTIQRAFLPTNLGLIAPRYFNTSVRVLSAIAQGPLPFSLNVKLDNTFRKRGDKKNLKHQKIHRFDI